MQGLLICWRALVAAVFIFWRFCLQILSNRFLVSINFKVLALTMSLSTVILFTIQPRNYNYRGQNENKDALQQIIDDDDETIPHHTSSTSTKDIVTSTPFIHDVKTKKCEKQTKIVYLKTHKCASSTLQNILFRFGEKNHLTFVLPSEGGNLNLGGYFNKRILIDTPWERAGLKYSIMALHTRYQRRQMMEVMGPGAKFITMLRDPVDVFESAYIYYRMFVKYNLTLEEFAHKTDRDKPENRILGIGKNQMLFDLGLEEKYLDNEEEVVMKIKQIDKHFDLVMIAEFFSESMVLLKHKLCWTTADVKSFHLNGRMENGKSKLDTETKQLLAKYLRSDYMLYNHFRKKFIEKMYSFGFEKIEKEVEELNKHNKYLADICSLRAAPNALLRGDQRWYGPSFLIGYQVNKTTENADCALMTMSGLKYIERIREKQRQEAEKLLRQTKRDNPRSL